VIWNDFGNLNSVLTQLKIMKKRIATFLILLFTLSITTLLAKEPVPASNAVSLSIAELVKSEIDYPDFARTDGFECCVLIRLTILEDGRFEIECANCKDDRLKMHVKDQVSKITSKEHAQFAGQTVALKVMFKLID
jgi:hypothetical protein